MLTAEPESIDALLRARPEMLDEWLVRWRARVVFLSVAVIVIGAGSFGAVMGCWRDLWQALYSGLKLPLVILLTTLGNGLLNEMLAPLLGLNITFRQSFSAVLRSFAVASLVLGALSPIALFLVVNTPPLTAGTTLSSPEFCFLQLALAAFIALSGCMGFLRVAPLLHACTRSAATSRNVLLAWLSGNLLLGSQICWVSRPFIWDPSRPVEFVGKEYFHGSFFETVFHVVCKMIFI